MSDRNIYPADLPQRNYAAKRPREDSVEEKQIRVPSVQTNRIRCTRVKDIGTRLSPDLKLQRAVEISQLPQGNSLTARAIYWFVTTEPVLLIIEDTNLFVWKESHTLTASNGTTYYLNQIDFHKNKRGTLRFRFPDETEDTIYCLSTHPNKNKRAKLSPANNNDMQLDDESQTATNYSAQPTPFNVEYNDLINQLGSNTISPNSSISPSGSGEMDFIYEVGVPQVPTSLQGQASPQTPSQVQTPFQVQTPPQVLPNGMQVASTEALIVNFLLLVPDNNECIQMAHSTLVNCGFTEEVSSTTQQRLYSLKKTNNTIRHVLLFPYEKADRLYVLDDYLPATSEVILLLENQDKQEDPLMAISHIANIGTNCAWEFVVKGADFRPIELNYSTLVQSVKLVVSIEQLREVIVGGASWRKGLGAAQLADPFKNFFLQWTLARVAKRVVRNIFLCFKFEPKGVIARTIDYAAKSLAALGIEYDLEDASVVNGSVLVYVRCPAYVLWYVLQRKKDILQTLKEDGLTEIYECFISDVETSMKRAGNEQFIEELEHLKEQMICDDIAEQPTPNKFRLVTLPNLPLITRSSSHVAAAAAKTLAPPGDVEPMIIDDLPIEYPPTLDKLPANKRKVLEEKSAELKNFDNKWNKTLEECYNSDQLRQQLFNFKTDKNAKIAVRVFIASASAGLATNVAKLMRPFRGKSIIDGVHSGLQIANTIIEWNQSGIVHIGELKHGNAVAVLFDIQDSVKFDFSEETAQKMISFIQKWNVEYRYSSDEFNSHRFVRDFLQYTMDVSLLDRFKGPLGSYMDYVMRTGDATPRLFSPKNGVMVFKTHEELEEADRALRNQLSDDENKLLKIFHRGFQLQEAANGKDVSSCCYGLPTNGLEILNDSGKPTKYN